MKKLRRKIVLAAFASTVTVFLLTILIVGLAVQLQLAHRADDVTELIVRYNGKLPSMKEYQQLEDRDRIRLYDFDEESPYRMRYFVVGYDGEDAVYIDTEHIAAVDADNALKLANNIKAGGDPTGYYDQFRYRYDTKAQMVVFIDFSDELDSAADLVLFMCGLALVFVLAITTVFWMLSDRIVRPFEENSRMQKQFITDASHELKTPLAIISANAEVLAYKDGENEWINNITEQVGRIGGLINELLTLNRLEEVDEISDIEPVDLSTLTEKTLSDFDEVFSSKNVDVTKDIDKDIVVNGNSAQLSRLLSVLIENASKYVSDNGEIRVSLGKDLRYVNLSVFNTCEIDKDADYKHLFDRFYRPDQSRASETGGHGIGLSIAKRIVTLHNGSIEAAPSDTGLSFNIKLSNKLKIHNNNK